VEEKGYKKIMNLPDQVNIHYIFIKSKKRYEIGRNYLPEKCPIFLRSGEWEKTRSCCHIHQSMMVTPKDSLTAGNNSGMSQVLV
jgi:hypothetical protein